MKKEFKKKFVTLSIVLAILLAGVLYFVNKEFKTAVAAKDLASETAAANNLLNNADIELPKLTKDEKQELVENIQLHKEKKSFFMSNSYSITVKEIGNKIKDKYNLKSAPSFEDIDRYLSEDIDSEVLKDKYEAALSVQNESKYNEVFEGIYDNHIKDLAKNLKDDLGIEVDEDELQDCIEDCFDSDELTAELFDYTSELLLNKEKGLLDLGNKLYKDLCVEIADEYNNTFDTAITHTNVAFAVNIQKGSDATLANKYNLLDSVLNDEDKLNDYMNILNRYIRVPVNVVTN